MDQMADMRTAVGYDELLEKARKLLDALSEEEGWYDNKVKLAALKGEPFEGDIVTCGNEDYYNALRNLIEATGWEPPQSEQSGA